MIQVTANNLEKSNEFIKDFKNCIINHISFLNKSLVIDITAKDKTNYKIELFNVINFNLGGLDFADLYKYEIEYDIRQISYAQLYIWDKTNTKIPKFSALCEKIKISSG